MRHTTRLPAFLPALLALPLVACAQVGGGDTTRPPDHTEDCEEIHDPIVIEQDSDWDQIPDGCWDLYSTLSLQGSEISSLEKLGDLKGINDLQIKNTKLTTLNSPKTLHVYGQLEVRGNSTLKDLKNLETEHAEDDLPVQITLDNNAVLVSADGLAGTTVIDGDLTVTNNPKLVKVSLDQLTEVKGTIKIQGNGALVGIDLQSIQSVANVTIRTNKSLTSLAPMSSLEQMAGTLIIDDNDALSTIGLFTSSMQTMVGVTITNNAVLKDLGQLSHLNGISFITINSNPMLSQCFAQEVPTCVPVHGTPAISNNLTASNCDYWCN